MQISLIAIGTRMPNWVTQGFEEYVKRMPPDISVKLVEVPAGKRSKSADLRRLLKKEGELSLAAVPKGARIVALDVKGQGWSTDELSLKLDSWRNDGRNVALLVGGPEGLAPECLQQAEQCWSLSNMTLPHPVVRIVVAEQLYRAWSILSNHPYHR